MLTATSSITSLSVLTLGTVLMSIYKPILFVLVLSGWAWLVGWLDKDLEHYFLQRRAWNAGQIGVAVLAFALLLFIPYFWVGLILALMLIASAFFSYAWFRNTQVPPEARWTFSMDSLRQRIEQVQASQATRRATVTLLAANGAKLELPPPNDPKAAAHEAVQDLMDFALPRGADRIDFTADAQHFTVAVHIDGVRFPQDKKDARLGVTIIEYLKDNAGLDVSDRRRRQTGQVTIDAGDYGRHVLDLSFAGSTREMTMSIFIDREAHTLLPFDQLGLLEIQKTRIRPVLAGDKGTVIIACPPGSGLTTTVYSIVNTHDPYTQSIVTLEEQVAFELEGVNHERIEPGTDANALSKRLAVILRGDPQVVMLSRLSDAQIARQIAAASAEVRFYVGMRQPDTFTALKVWLKAVGDLTRGGEGIAAIISQRLVRNLCPVCRVAYKPDPEALRKLNLPAERVSQLYKHTGQVMVRDRPQPCTNCHTLGYRGRVGVFEVLTMDDEGKQLVAAGQLDQLRAHLRRQKMLWLQEAALYKAVEGVTSVNEIMRALVSEKKT